jgi:Zn-finger nucleic acid-binding protein
MTESTEKRHQVRAENPSGACGYIEHMTIDELKARAVGEDFDATCPACGMFHLTKSEIDKLNSEKVTDSKSYANMKEQAEES